MREPAPTRSATAPVAPDGLLPTASAGEARRAALRLVLRHRRLTVATTAALVVGNGTALVVPWLFGAIVDAALRGDGPTAITAPVVTLTAVVVIATTASALAAALVARLGERALADLREQVVARALLLPVDDLEHAGAGDLVARVAGDVSVVTTAIREVVPAFASSAITLVLTVVGLFALDWRFALAGLLAAPVQAHTLRWYLASSGPLYAAERIAEGARAQQLLDSFSAAETVRAFGLVDDHVARIAERSAAAKALSLAAIHLRTRFFGRLNLAELLGLSAVLIVGYRLVGAGTATIGTATAAALYFHNAFGPINVVLGLFDDAQRAGAALARLVGIADLPVEPAGRSLAVAAAPRIRLEAVSFAYRGGPVVVDDLDLDVAPGERVALVGPSGAGKTTVAKIVAGIHPPDAGRALLAGHPISGLDRGDLRRHVVLINQEVHVFTGPLADDLRLAAPGASDDEVRGALADVGADWVTDLAEGIDTVVGTGGHRLTTTQAQQLALARLRLVDPAVAILDEATADAGSAGARLLDRATDRILAGRTAIVVAHRLSQASAADRIVVLDHGRIVEQGSHHQLVRAGGTYAELWSAWASGRPT